MGGRGPPGGGPAIGGRGPPGGAEGRGPIGDPPPLGSLANGLDGLAPNAGGGPDICGGFGALGALGAIIAASKLGDSTLPGAPGA